MDPIDPMDSVHFHRTVGMYFLIFPGNKDDIEWYEEQGPHCPVEALLPRECDEKYCPREISQSSGDLFPITSLLSAVYGYNTTLLSPVYRWNIDHTEVEGSSLPFPNHHSVILPMTIIGQALDWRHSLI